jgi:hypothetical protein
LQHIPLGFPRGKMLCWPVCNEDGLTTFTTGAYLPLSRQDATRITRQFKGQSRPPRLSQRCVKRNIIRMFNPYTRRHTSRHAVTPIPMARERAVYSPARRHKEEPTSKWGHDILDYSQDLVLSELVGIAHNRTSIATLHRIPSLALRAPHSRLKIPRITDNALALPHVCTASFPS